MINIYPDDAGETHFRELEVEMHPYLHGVVRSDSLGVPTALHVVESPADYDHDFVNAPRRQFSIPLSGMLEVTVSDGETRIVRPGDILLLEDTTGKGHRTRAVDNQPRRGLFIPLDAGTH